MASRHRFKGNPNKIDRYVKYTYRLFRKNGESEYRSAFVGQLVGDTTNRTIDYLVKHFKEILSYSETLEKVKLISVDGTKVNEMIS